VTGSCRWSSGKLSFAGDGSIRRWHSLDFPHTTRYSPRTTTIAPMTLISY